MTEERKSKAPYHCHVPGEKDNTGHLFDWHSSEGMNVLVTALCEGQLSVLSRYLSETNEVHPLVRKTLAAWMDPSRNQQLRLEVVRRQGAPKKESLRWRDSLIDLVHQQEAKKLTKKGRGFPTAVNKRTRKYLREKLGMDVSEKTVRNAVAVADSGNKD